MKGNPMKILLIVFVLFQLGLVGNMVYKENEVLFRGKEFRFRCAMYDPVHPFAGRYMQLNFQNSCVKPEPGVNRNSEQAFLILGKDSLGFAKPLMLVNSATPRNEDYLSLNFPGSVGNRIHGNDSCVMVNYPFDRYYLAEGDAAAAEKLVAESLRDTSVTVWVSVKVYRGSYVLKDVYIGDRTLKSMLGN